MKTKLTLAASVIIVGAALLSCDCAAHRPPQLKPFDRAVLLFYDAHQKNGRTADALLRLELALNQPRTVLVRAFDERDRPLTLDAKSITWSGSPNLRLEPETGAALVKVTLISGGDGWVMVSSAGHKAEIQVRSTGN